MKKQPKLCTQKYAPNPHKNKNQTKQNKVPTNVLFDKTKIMLSQKQKDKISHLKNIQYFKNQNLNSMLHKVKQKQTQDILVFFFNQIFILFVC